MLAPSVNWAEPERYVPDGPALIDVSGGFAASAPVTANASAHATAAASTTSAATREV